MLLTPDKSTPVNAATAGGNWLTNLLISDVVLSAPPSKTISSVLANGAATSAAIWNDWINILLLMTWFSHDISTIIESVFKFIAVLFDYLWQGLENKSHNGCIPILFVGRCFHPHSLRFSSSNRFNGTSFCSTCQTNTFSFSTSRFNSLRSAIEL